MNDTSTTIPALVLAGVFAYAAVMKMVRPAAWHAALAEYRFGRAEPGLRILVPGLEAAIAVVCVFSPLVGSGLALGLLAAMAAAVIRASRARVDGRLRCGCFGGTAQRSAQTLLLRIVALSAIAGVALAGSGGLWTEFEPLPAILVLVGLTAAVGTIALWRHASKDFIRR